MNAFQSSLYPGPHGLGLIEAYHINSGECTGERYPGPHGLGLIEAGLATADHWSRRQCIPGRMAWASLKLDSRPQITGHVALYPGPHGLGLIEALDEPRYVAPSPAGIPGRMAWASLKRGDGIARQGYELMYPGPHGLGLIEAGGNWTSPT